MRIVLNNREYEGNYVQIVERMKENCEEFVGTQMPTIDYANDVEYLALRFFDRDIDAHNRGLEEKCEALVKGLLKKGIAKRIE